MVLTYQFKDNEQNIVHDKWPLPSISIRCDSKQNRADGAEHKYQSNSPGNVRVGLVKSLGQFRNSERNSKEIEGIPGLYPHPRSVSNAHRDIMARPLKLAVRCRT